MKSQGMKLTENAPPIEYVDHSIRMSDGSIKTISVPEGIDPGWGYNVGASGFRDAA